jgi:hypothetical protein
MNVSREIDALKSAGQYRAAGKLAFTSGRDDQYGCHFGMRSERETAAAEFRAGWSEAKAAAAAPKKINTILKSGLSKGGACVVRLTNGAGEVFVYGVFGDVESAKEFVRTECRGFTAEVEPLYVIDR